MQTSLGASRRRLLPPRPSSAGPRFYWLPRDGWLTLLLTVLIIYITVVSVQSVQPVWTTGLDALTGAMFAGIVLGYIATQQNTISNGWMHLIATALGVLVSFQTTASVAVNGDRRLLLHNTYVWFQRAFSPNGSSADNSVFLLFLSVLTFLLAYMTMWLVFHARRPWLAVVANAVVLLINLNETTSDEFYFLIVFLVLALLLLVRFTLAENVRHWRRAGIRFSPDLGWDFMQAGAIFAVIVALLPNLLPIAQPDQALVNYLNSNSGPLAAVTGRVESLFSGVSGKGPGGLSFFGTNLALVGNVDLPNTEVLHYTVNDPLQNDPSQYLITEAFSTYDGTGLWTRSQSADQNYAAGQSEQPSTNEYHLDTYHIVFDATPTNGERFILAPGSTADSFSIPSIAQTSVFTEEPITWLAQRPLTNGDGYTATGYVSTASGDQLSAVPYPTQAAIAGKSVYPPAIIDEYLPAEPVISPYIANLAQQVTKGAPNMYAAANDIQNYLAHNFTYNAHNPNPPTGQDATVWFLQRKVGFCTFFASAMALMGRSLGMPTRIVSGYSYGSYDQKTHTYVVRGTQAHTWTQVYFAQYGWINFEPTATFTPFFRPLTAGSNTTGGATAGATPKASATPHNSRQRTTDKPITTTTSAAKNSLVHIGLVVGIILLIVLLALGGFWYWWRSLFRAYSPTASSFARLILLGVWAGAPPRPSQTPRAYARRLAAIAPERRAAIEQVGALYARERWGDPLSQSEVKEVSSLYEQGRLGLISAIVRRVQQVPHVLGEQSRRLRARAISRLRSEF